jgi:hypothetical protein
MKSKTLISILVVIGCSAAYGQGFLYDQQSGTLISQIEGGTGASVGVQSFTPGFSSVGFLQVYVSSSTGGTLQMVLRTDGPTGAVLGASQSATFQGAYFGVVDFVFTTPVSVIPNGVYYFQPVSLTGSWSWGLLSPFYATYSGGTAFFNGVASPINDFFFREGIIVPEPSSVALATLGGVAAWCARRRFRHESRKCPNTR